MKFSQIMFLSARKTADNFCTCFTASLWHGFPIIVNIFMGMEHDL